jgi:hypothetical protein
MTVYAIIPNGVPITVVRAAELVRWAVETKDPLMIPEGAAALETQVWAWITRQNSLRLPLR